MFAPMQVCAPPSLISQSAAFVFDRFVRRPLRGLVAISEAAAVLVSRLLQAAVTAIFKAISRPDVTPGQGPGLARDGGVCAKAPGCWPGRSACAARCSGSSRVVFGLLVPAKGSCSCW